MRILLAEDDELLGSGLSDALTRAQLTFGNLRENGFVDLLHEFGLGF